MWYERPFLFLLGFRKLVYVISIRISFLKVLLPSEDMFCATNNFANVIPDVVSDVSKKTKLFKSNIGTFDTFV